jgi:hypothetical protein
MRQVDPLRPPVTAAIDQTNKAMLEFRASETALAQRHGIPSTTSTERSAKTYGRSQA